MIKETYRHSDGRLLYVKHLPDDGREWDYEQEAPVIEYKSHRIVWLPGSFNPVVLADGESVLYRKETIAAPHRYSETISSPRYGWHCTTERKLEKYRQSGRILRPVRFWPSLELAEAWAKSKGRFVIKIELPCISYPLPDHKPALWCPSDVTKFDIEA